MTLGLSAALRAPSSKYHCHSLQQLPHAEGLQQSEQGGQILLWMREPNHLHSAAVASVASFCAVLVLHYTIVSIASMLVWCISTAS